MMTLSMTISQIPSIEQVYICTQKTQLQVPKPPTNSDPKLEHSMNKLQATNSTPVDLSLTYSSYITRNGIKEFERHMTGNRAHLEDYQELSKVGSVTFGGSKGSISGKGTIRLGNLVFDDVAFVKELGHFNLFSISQICDKKLNVLFTEKECFVVSSDFKMPDENQLGSYHPQDFTNDHNLCCVPEGKQHKPPVRPQIDRFVDPPFTPPCIGLIWTYLFEEIENQLNQKVKIIRTDNGTEFKNRVMLEFCGEKDSMNYIPVSLQNQANPAGLKEVIDIDVQTEEAADLMMMIDARNIGFMIKSCEGFTITHLKEESNPLEIPIAPVQTKLSQEDHCELNAQISEALEDETWVEAMQEELLQFKLQQVWGLGTKQGEAQGHRQEEVIDYMMFLHLYKRLEAAARLFLAFAIIYGFYSPQMDVKSAFLITPRESVIKVVKAYDIIIRAQQKKSWRQKLEALLKGSYSKWKQRPLRAQDEGVCVLFRDCQITPKGVPSLSSHRGYFKYIKGKTKAWLYGIQENPPLYLVAYSTVIMLHANLDQSQQLVPANFLEAVNLMAVAKSRQ
ncbi:hypothetical protein Tco_0565850 [Tanacetum coccineum]